MSTQPSPQLPTRRRFRKRWAWGLVAALLAVVLLAMGYSPGPDRPYRVEKARTLQLKTEPSALAWSPDGKQLAALSSLFTHVTVWNTDTWEIIREIDVARSMMALNWLTFTPDSRHILVAADSDDVVNRHASAVFWDIQTGMPVDYVVSPFEGGDPRANIVKVMALSRDGNFLALRSTSFPDKQIAFYSNHNWKSPALISIDNDLTSSMEFSPDGQLLALGTYHGWLDFLDVQNQKITPAIQIYELAGHGLGIRALAFSPNGHLIATAYGGPIGNKTEASNDEPLQLFDVEKGRILARSRVSSTRVLSVAWSNDGKVLAAADDNGHVSLLMPPTLEKAAGNVILGGPALGVKFAPDRPVFAAPSGKSVVVYKIAHR